MSVFDEYEERTRIAKLDARIADLETELNQCLTVHAEYSNRMEAEVKKWTLETCKWQDAHSDAKEEISQLKNSVDSLDNAYKTSDESRSIVMTENNRIKKAIQKYLDSQTTNQWVMHFRKVMR